MILHEVAIAFGHSCSFNFFILENSLVLKITTLLTFKLYAGNRKLEVFTSQKLNLPKICMKICIFGHWACVVSVVFSVSESLCL